MDSHAEKFYRPISDDGSGGKFHEVIALHEAPDIPWRELSAKLPLLPRGWHELALLPVADRIEFCRDFWLSRFPYHPGFSEFLCRFFGSLDDLGVYLTQKKWGDSFDAHIVYSLAGDSGFYTGGLCATEEQIADMQSAFPDYIFPIDFKAFLQIHDGFSKATDSTGIIRSIEIHEKYERFQRLIQTEIPITTLHRKTVNPKSLIPFYESFGCPYFQCFWGDWYPLEEMGNVYYSHTAKTISESRGNDSDSETMAFPTFTDWLIFYLEPIG